MSSLNGVETRYYLARGIVQESRDDTPVAIRMRYLGTGTVTSVTVVTATDLTLITSDGGTDAYAFATYTTVGSLADAINTDGIFEAVVLDALRADLVSSSQLVTGAITSGSDANGVTIWDVKTDTSVLKAMIATLVWDRNFNTTKLNATHRVHLREISYNLNVSAAEANAVRVYIRRGTTETQIFGHVSVDATITTISFAGGYGKLSGNDGDAIIVKVLDATSVTDAAANYVRASGEAE